MIWIGLALVVMIDGQVLHDTSVSTKLEDCVEKNARLQANVEASELVARYKLSCIDLESLQTPNREETAPPIVRKQGLT